MIYKYYKWIDSHYGLIHGKIYIKKDIWLVVKFGIF